MPERPLTGWYVAVCGPDADATEEDLADGHAVGSGLAAAGAVVLTGGLYGVMQAAAAGVREAGGLALGLLPGTDRSAASPEHHLTVPTGLGELRNGLLVSSADCVIAIGDGWGTLSEVAFALRIGVPLVRLRGREVEGLDEACLRVDTSVEAVAAVLRLPALR